MLVLVRERVLGRLHDVLDGHQAAQFEGVIDDQHALQAVAVHQVLGIGRRRAFAHGDELFLGRHDRAHRLVQAALETQVTVRHDTDELSALDDRETGNAMLARQRDHIAHLHVRRNRDRIAQNA